MTTASLLADFWNDQILAEREAGPVPGAGRLHPLLRLHPDEHPPDAQPARALVAGQRGQRERRPPAPPRLRHRHDDDRRRGGVLRARRQPLRRDLRLCLRSRGRADDRRVRALGLPGRRLLGRAGPRLDRRDGDRRGGDGTDSARLHPLQLRDRLSRRNARQHRYRPRRLRPGRRLLRKAAAPARRGRLLRLPDRDLRRGADRQAGIALGAAPLRRAAAGEAGEGGGRFLSDRRTERFKNAFRDAVGGKPNEALAEVRRIAEGDDRPTPPSP